MFNLDKLTGILIVLFILSIITEKLTNLIRKYPFQSRVVFLCVAVYIFVCSIYTWVRYFMGAQKIDFLFAAVAFVLSGLLMAFLVAIFLLGVYGEKIINKNNKKKKGGLLLYLVKKYPFKFVAKNVDAAEGQVEKEVTLLSFLVGMVVAALCNTNVFLLFSDMGSANNVKLTINLFSEPRWINFFYSLNPDFRLELTNTAGIIATGFFLSFGSKFFHDVLDTILQVKNLRRKQNEDFGSVESVKELEDIMYATPGEMMQTAIEQNLPKLKEVPGFVGIYIGQKTVNGSPEKAIMIDTSAISPVGFPTTISATLGSGRKITFPVTVNSNVGIPKAHVGAGSKVANGQSLAFAGTITCALQDGVDNFRLLTCSHVLTNGNFINHGGDMTPEPVMLMNDTPAPLGNWVYGYQDTRFDIALITPDATVMTSLTKSGCTRVMPYKSIAPEMDAVMHGAVSGQLPVKVAGTHVSTQIAYENKVETMHNLIKLSNPELGQLSQKGDSGALLYTANGEAVGMVIGGNGQYSYAISMESILEVIPMNIY